MIEDSSQSQGMPSAQMEASLATDTIATSLKLASEYY